MNWTLLLPQAYTGAIRYVRSIDGGKTYSAPFTINDDKRFTSHRFEWQRIDVMPQSG